MSKICAISDMHGYFPKIEPCDLLLICGDNVPLNIQCSYRASMDWYINTFQDWADNLPCEQVLFICGNHEVGVEYFEDELEDLFDKSDKITFLYNSGFTFNGLNIYGTPFCKQFGKWAYMEDDEKLSEIYSKIPNNLDILITHDVPYGYADILKQDVPWNNHEHIGNKPLGEAILKKQPRYHFSGHLHSCEHELTMIGHTKHYNVSLKDEKYQPVYQPLYLEI